MHGEGPKEKSGLSKLLVGCGIGCGAILVVALFLGAFGTWWVMTPGKQVTTALIAGEESAGVVQLNDLADDPGVQAVLLEALKGIEEVNRRQQEAVLPESLRWLGRLRRSPSTRELNRILPKDGTLVFERGEDGAPEWVVALNFRTMVRPFKLMFDFAAGHDPNARHFEHRGYHVYELDNTDGTVLAFVESTLLVAASDAAIETALDRVADKSGDVATLERAVAGAPEGEWDAAGFLGNDGGLASEFLVGGRLVDEAPEGDDRELVARFGVDVLTSDEAKGTLVLDCADRERALAWLERIEARLEEIAREAEGEALRLEADARAEGRTVVVDLRLHGLEGAVAGLFDSVGDVVEDVTREAVERP